MTYAELLHHFKTQKAAGDAIGVAQPTVAGWKDDGIPLPRQAQYEVVTRGALRADPLPKKDAGVTRIAPQ